jgi:hypothetical protein
MWRSIQSAFKSDKIYSLFDNSLGAASLFRFADPHHFTLNGYDIDRDLIQKVSESLSKSDFKLDLRCADLASVQHGRYSAALINPPFSITLSSPTLRSYPGVTHYGKHGPNTSALSHEYALASALESCDIVAAILPRGTSTKLSEFDIADNRLRAVYQLPNDTFAPENVKNVKCDLLIFGRSLRGVVAKAPLNVRVKQGKIDDQSNSQQLFQLFCRATGDIHAEPIKPICIDESNPVITLAPSHDKRVILKRAGRHIKMTFFDGATEGYVKNTLFKYRLYSTREHRYPPKTHYAGQMKLNLDVIVLQQEPFKALQNLADMISQCGGEPTITRQRDTSPSKSKIIE